MCIYHERFYLIYVISYECINSIEIISKIRLLVGIILWLVNISFTQYFSGSTP